MDRYRHLWQPKKSAYDWGHTEYKIVRNWTPREAVVAKEASANREQQGGVGGASQNRVGVASQEGEGQEEEEDVLPTKSFTTVKLKVPTADELVSLTSSSGGRFKGLLGRMKTHGSGTSLREDGRTAQGKVGRVVGMEGVVGMERVVGMEGVMGNVKRSGVGREGVKRRKRGEAEVLIHGEVRGRGGGDGGLMPDATGSLGFRITGSRAEEAVSVPKRRGGDAEASAGGELRSGVRKGKVLEASDSEKGGRGGDSEKGRIGGDSNSAGGESDKSLPGDTAKRRGGKALGACDAGSKREKRLKEGRSKVSVPGDIGNRVEVVEREKNFVPSAMQKKSGDSYNVSEPIPQPELFHVSSDEDKAGEKLSTTKVFELGFSGNSEPERGIGGVELTMKTTPGSPGFEEPKPASVEGDGKVKDISSGLDDSGLQVASGLPVASGLEPEDVLESGGVDAEESDQSGLGSSDVDVVGVSGSSQGSNDMNQEVARSDRGLKGRNQSEEEVGVSGSHQGSNDDDDGQVDRSGEDLRQNQSGEEDTVCGSGFRQTVPTRRKPGRTTLGLVGTQEDTAPRSARSGVRKTRSRQGHAKQASLEVGRTEDPLVRLDVGRTEDPLVRHTGPAQSGLRQAKSRRAKPDQATAEASESKGSNASDVRHAKSRRAKPDQVTAEASESKGSNASDVRHAKSRRAKPDQTTTEASESKGSNASDVRHAKSRRAKPDQTTTEASESKGSNTSAKSEHTARSRQWTGVRQSKLKLTRTDGDEGAVAGLDVDVGQGEWEMDATMPPPSRKRQHSSSSTSAKRKKTSEGVEQCTVKLWCPKGVHRTPRDLSELDVCMSTYDSVVMEAMEDTEDTEVQQMLAQHWKKTQKQMLTVIADVHAVTDLERKCKKEKSKSIVLQKKLHSRLAHVKKAGEEYRVAMDKSAKAKKAAQMEALKEKIRVEAEELRPVLSKLFCK